MSLLGAILDGLICAICGRDLETDCAYDVSVCNACRADTDAE